jgi:hypothetical protein
LASAFGLPDRPPLEATWPPGTSTERGAESAAQGTVRFDPDRPSHVLPRPKRLNLVLEGVRLTTEPLQAQASRVGHLVDDLQRVVGEREPKTFAEPLDRLLVPACLVVGEAAGVQRPLFFWISRPQLPPEHIRLVVTTRFEQHPSDLAAPVGDYAPVQLDCSLEGGDRLVVLAGGGQREPDRLEHVRYFPVSCLRIVDTPLGNLASLVVPAFPEDRAERLPILRLDAA